MKYKVRKIQKTIAIKYYGVYQASNRIQIQAITSYNTYTARLAYPQCGSMLLKSRGAFSINTYATETKQVATWYDTQEKSRRTRGPTNTKFYTLGRCTLMKEDRKIMK